MTAPAPAGPPLVLTVTPNPSLDLLFHAERLVWDDANRLADPRRRPGGQGVNVSRAVHALGGSSVAALLLGGRTGTELETMLTAERLPLRVLRAAGETRTFVAVRETDADRTLLLNARGPDRSAGDASRLAHVVLQALAELRPAWVACCGSLPAGFPPDFYLELARAARAAGARVVVDCDGEALQLAAPVCDLLVPNQHEAARLTGTAVESVADAAVAALNMLGLGPALACVTLGAAGAVLATGREAWHAAAPDVAGGSTVGAGDTFLAALLCALDGGGHPQEALSRAVAAATAVLDSTGAALVSAARARELEPAVALTVVQKKEGG